MVNRTLASMCVLLACAATAVAQTGAAYYPIQVGHRWSYVTSDPKNPPDAKQKGADLQKQLVIEVERAEDVMRKVKKMDKEVEEKFAGFILKMTSGNKVKRDHVVVMNDGVHRFNVNGAAINPPVLFLKFGLKSEGEKWDWDSASGNAEIKGTCIISSTATAGQVRVPYKNRAPLDGIIITFSNKKTGAERQEVMTWYVANVGMVKQHVKAGSHEIVHELVEFTPAK